MAVTVREVLRAADDVPQTTVVTGAGTQVGDLLLLVHQTDFFGVSQMLTPSPGTWTGPVIIGRDDGTNNPHIKVWWRPVTSAGAQTVESNCTSDPSNHNHTFVLAGADTTDPITGSAASTGTGSSQAAPSVTGADGGLLVCGWIKDAQDTYTPPASMTGGESDSGFSIAASAHEALTADGATGTRTATAGTGAGGTWTAVAVGIAPASGGAGDVTGEAASTAPAATAAGTGTVEVAGTGAATASAATSAATGTVTVSGVSGATAPAGVAAGTGGVVVSGSGSSVAPAGVAAGVGAVAVSGSGASVAPAGVAAGAGVVGELPGVIDLTVTIGPMRDGALATVGTMRDAAAATVAGMAPATAVGPMRTSYTVGEMRE